MDEHRPSQLFWLQTVYQLAIAIFNVYGGNRRSLASVARGVEYVATRV